MAGTIAADTLTHSTAGSLTTDYVVNGSAKAWCRFVGSSATAADSLNTSSILDNSAGQFTPSCISAFSTAEWCVIVGGDGGSLNGSDYYNTLHTTTAFQARFWYPSTYADPNRGQYCGFGELA